MTANVRAGKTLDAATALEGTTAVIQAQALATVSSRRAQNGREPQKPWIVNPNNSRGLDENFVSANLVTDIAKWEDAADGIVGDAGFIDILGEGSVTADTLVADTVSTDGKNEVYFADIEGQNTIGITIVWGIFNGPPRWRELVEWDQVYNDADFDWSEDCNSEDCTTKMDFESIATHELGHSVGLDDLYMRTDARSKQCTATVILVKLPQEL
jgi:hypothetical protein